MKNKLILLCMFALQLNSFSQNETRHWYFGTNAGLDFSTSPPTILTNGALVTHEGCAAISDAAGNLLLYTDGSTIYNKNHVAMANGSGLTGNSSTTQSAIIVKKPGSSSIYYVFTLGVSGVQSLNFSTVDMTLAAGVGSVTVKNTFLADSMSEKLTSVMHCNGKDIWVVAHDNKSNNFYSYLVTTAGVGLTPVLTGIGTIYGPWRYWQGAMKISPNGKKLGVPVSGNPGSFEVYDFDNTTGVLSNLLSLSPYENAYGCEFSPDGSKFYGVPEPATAFSTPIYQWNLCAGNPAAIILSRYTITAPSLVTGPQLARNGKIYLSRLGAQMLAVISDPNNLGAACNYIHAGQSIAPKTGNVGLPNFVASYLKASLPVTYTVNCYAVMFDAPFITNTVNAGCGAVVATPTTVLWNFGDPGSGSANSSTLQNPSHTYPAAGTYTVLLITNNPCSSDTLRLPVIVASNAPSLSISGSLNVCKGEIRTYTVTGASSYTWDSGANTNTFSITTPSITTSYSVSGATATNSCLAKKQFTVTVSECTGVEAEGGKRDGLFSIYPNPANRILFVETSITIKVNITDISGLLRLERSFEPGKHRLDISDLSYGNYIIQGVSERGVYTMRLVRIE